jgi:serine/threonine protein kinase
MVATGKTKKIFDGRFEIVGIVGRGSQSVVYHAQNAQNPNNHVALKVLVNHQKTASNQQLNERLRKEALAMVAARHRYVIRIEDFHSLDSLCYLSMEYAPEGDLRKYVSSRTGKLPAMQAERLFMQIVEALCAVHKSGIIHRDIKPDNILVLNDQEVRLGDFGTAVLPGDESSIEELRTGVGTFAYMAPEVLEGIEYTESADLYALGVTFYELLAGKHPFEGVAMMKQLTVRQNQNIPPISKLCPSISQKFAQMIMKCMSYNQAERPKSAEELLEFMISEQPTPTKSTPLAQKVQVVAEPKPSVMPPMPPPSAIENTYNKSVRESALNSFPSDSPSQTSPTEALKAKGPIAERGVSIPTPMQMPTQLTSSENAATKTSLVSEALETKPKEFTPQKEKTHNSARELLNSSKKSPLPRNGVSQQKPRSHFAILFLLLLAGIVFWKFNNTSASAPSEENQVESPQETMSEAIAAPSSDEPLIPEASTEKNQFPVLSAGMYHGEISGLYGNSIHSLTIISLPELQKMAFIIGIEGSIPAVISTEGLNPGDSISVPANGFILKITGQQLEDGEVLGFFKNTINDTQGEWRVKQLVKAIQEE